MRIGESCSQCWRTWKATVLATIAVLTVGLTDAPPVGGAPSASAPAGPALSVARAELERSLHCPGGLAPADRDVILLVPGTTLDPRTNFGYSWMKAFDARGLPYCYVVTPDSVDDF